MDVDDALEVAEFGALTHYNRHHTGDLNTVQCMALYSEAAGVLAEEVRWLQAKIDTADKGEEKLFEWDVVRRSPYPDGLEHTVTVTAKDSRTALDKIYTLCDGVLLGWTLQSVRYRGPASAAEESE